MKKLLIATAVSAAFAAPSLALAQAARAPTLSQVLDASGITVNGYIDVGYSRADRDIEGGVSTRVFDSQNNSFDLHQFGLSVSKLPRSGFGGLVNLTVGSDAQVIHSFPDTSASLFDVTQAYAQYADKALTVIAGKFATLHGTEVIWSPSNTNVSRSILFGAIPFTHTGVRATWALSDTVSLIGGVNNGWDQIQDQNRSKTVELGATLNPIRPLNISVSAYSGKEPSPPLAPTINGTRTSVNATGSYSISDAINVGAELLNVSQDVPAGGGTTSAKYTGAALYGSYMFTRRIRGALRVENFDDKDGIRFGVAGTKYREVTATGAYLAADNFEARAELRRDQATNAVFTDFSGGTSKSLMTIALQGLYKF
ncbi:MAG TPA: outer membrane beta-barrel protein [Burkholderiales bacterium]|nr:outer membrane beta-barrel protein [Burkholderiales bacterium]